MIEKLERFFFISDVHLGHETAEISRIKETEIVRFLNFVKENTKKLFILGDFFDVWFEYKLAIPKGHARVLGKLAELSDSGIEIFYVLGNHDFWARDYFEKEIGAKVYKDDLIIELNGKRFYISHGDGLLKNDKGYRIFRKILRNKFNIALFSLLHPDLGLRLANASSRKSREYSSNRDSRQDEKDIIEFATEKINEGFDYVVLGHLHKPKILKINTGFYINIGDWLWNFTYGTFQQEFEIKMWKFANEEHQRLFQKRNR